MDMTVAERKPLRHYTCRLREEFRENGSLGTAGFMLSECARRFFRTNRAAWYRLELAELDAPARRNSSIWFGTVSIERASDFFREHHERFPWMYVNEELDVGRRYGHMFPCAIDGETIVGYVKLGIEKVFVLDYERILCLPPAVAYIYDTFVMPSHRGRGIGSLLVAAAAQKARDERYRALWCHIPPWNDPSKKIFKRVGFKSEADIRFFRIMGMEFFWQRPEALLLKADRVQGGPDELRFREALSA